MFVMRWKFSTHLMIYLTFYYVIEPYAYPISIPENQGGTFWKPLSISGYVFNKSGPTKGIFLSNSGP